MPIFNKHLMFFCISFFIAPISASSSQESYQFREHTDLFDEAIRYDLSGNHLKAREDYTILRTGPLASVAAIPDAINLFALSLDEQALEIFKQVQSKGKQYDVEYASLWIELLNAKNGKKNDFALSINFTTQPAKLIQELYSKKKTLDTFFVELEKLTFASDQARKDAVTQSVFFASCYAKYIVKDKDAALKVVQDNRSDFLFYSLERPLMDEGFCA